MVVCRSYMSLIVRYQIPNRVRYHIQINETTFWNGIHMNATVKNLSA